ncbi:MAG: site-specific DNA-methyltransferase [Terrimicrobiaceae bacterium]
MTIEHLKTSDLIPYARNAKKHDASQVAKLAGSIREYGFTNPVLIDNDNGIIAGHGRVLAAQSLALESVPCIRLGHLTDTQRRAYILADNRLAEIGGGWDEEMLKLELADLAALDVDVAEIGFGAEDLAELEMEDEPETSDADAEPQIDKAEELRAKWGVEPGQLWELGDHRLMCGDSTIPDHVAKLMGGERAGLCFTSPPYGAGNVAKLRDHYVRGAKKRDSFYKDHKDNPDEWAELMAGWFAAARPHVECVICNVQMLADNKTDLIRWVADRCDDLVDVVIWDKIHAAPQMQSGVMSNAFEFLWVFGGNGSRSMPFADWHGTVSNIVRIDPRGKNDNADNHRAVMPIDLPLWVINTLCPKASSVLEPFCGTGTTIIACEQLGRKCRAIEISPAYVAVAIQRWADATGKEPKRLA